jgi:hypothetical protein
VVAASVARVRSVGGEREAEGEAEPESRRRRRRWGEAGGLRRLSGLRRERRESGVARRREDAIGGDLGRKEAGEGLGDWRRRWLLLLNPDGLILPARILQWKLYAFKLGLSSEIRLPLERFELKLGTSGKYLCWPATP